MKAAILAGLMAGLMGAGSGMALAQAKAPVQSKPQFRGMWVTAWGRGLKSAAEIDRLVKTSKEAHLNALLVQVRKRGDAYYFSDTEPHASDVAPNFDPLATLIEKAHASGIEVHAWLVMYPSWSSKKYSPPADHVLAEHPEWATVHKKGYRMTLQHTDEGIFLDPGLLEVQDYLTEVALELPRKYAVDGIHLDYIRYPGREWGYHPGAVRRFKQETAHTPTGAPHVWDQWRRQQVTNLVRRISKGLDASHPSVKLSAAVFPTHKDSHLYRLQEWERWTKEKLVDFVAPMNYATTRTRFASRSRDLMSRGGPRPVYMGVGGGNKPEAAVIQQMQDLQSKGVSGIILYHYDGNSPQFWNKVKSRLFQRPSPVPQLPWKPKDRLASQPQP